MFTFGGKTLVELVSGRIPRVSFALEHANPQQLTTSSTPAELSDQSLQHLPQSHIRKPASGKTCDEILYARLFPSELPFVLGDRLFYWQDI